VVLLTNESDEIVFRNDERPVEDAGERLPPWLVLLVDDDREVHRVTRLVLSDLVFQGRSLHFVSAFSADEARSILRRTHAISVCMLDVVMETDTAGLDLIHYIRSDLANYEMRLILRTGEPGMAPERDVVLRYDINDYKAKTELTQGKLVTSMISALRGYQQIVELNRHRRHLAATNRTLEQRVAERTTALHKAEQRWRSVLDAAVHPMVISRLGDGLVRYANQRATDLFGDSLQIGQRAPTYYVSPTDGEVIARKIRENGLVEDQELLLRRPDGTQFWALLSGVSMEFEGECCELISFNDISRRKAREEDLILQATTDPLTGAVNRRYFVDVGERELRRARRFRHAVCMVTIDLDHFKLVNDTYGHGVGDVVLQNTVEAVAGVLRDTDILARLGGEEFAVLLPETSITGAMAMAERLRLAIAQTEQGVPGLDLVTASLGVAQLTGGSENLHSLLERADRALYRAKHNGRNRDERAEEDEAPAL
jgi:diguanylate cyclase (GGDEF)-like protein/PAS domain S-box-containing protein